MALTKQEKGMIKGLMREQAWQALMKFVALKTEQWKGQPVGGKDAFETLRSLHTRDGKVEGINELFDEMEKTVSE